MIQLIDFLFLTRSDLETVSELYAVTVFAIISSVCSSVYLYSSFVNYKLNLKEPGVFLRPTSACFLVSRRKLESFGPNTHPSAL